jgi:hypothetical protein
MSDLFDKLRTAERRRYGALQSLIRAQTKLDHVDLDYDACEAVIEARADVTEAAHDFVEASLAFDAAQEMFQRECEGPGQAEAASEAIN